jgi:CRP/FNR family cyclic AMP-dependent transcriptional regulator
MNALLAACRHLPPLAVAPGTVLLEEGTATGRLFVLIDGELSIVRAGVEIATVNDPGAVLGEISALLGGPHTATVRAANPARVYRIENAAEFLLEETAIVFAIAQMLARRLKSASAYLADIKTQFQDRSDHFGMIDQVLSSIVFQPVAEAAAVDDRPGDPRL